MGLEFLDDPDGHPIPASARTRVLVAARRRLRRRRLVGAGSAGLVLVLAAGLVGGTSGGGGKQQVSTLATTPTTVDPSPATTSTTDDQSATSATDPTATTDPALTTDSTVTSTTVAGAGATTTPSSATTPTTKAASSPTSAKPRTTSATNRATTTTMAATTTEPTEAPVRLCTDNPADLQVVPTTDKAVYAVGERITITISVTNVSTSRCLLPFGDAKHYAQAVQLNAAGSPLPVAAWGDPIDTTFTGTTSAIAFDPGNSKIYQTQWDQHSCDDTCVNNAPHTEGAQVPAGRYQITGILPLGLGNGPFRVTTSSTSITIGS